MSRCVATAFPLTLSLSRKGRGNPRNGLFIQMQTAVAEHKGAAACPYDLFLRAKVFASFPNV